MDITSVNGNNSWKFQDATMKGTLTKKSDGRADRQTEIAAWSQLKIILSWIFYLVSWLQMWYTLTDLYNIETVSPEDTFCDTVQVPSGAGDMQLI